MPAEQAAREECGDVSRPDGKQDGERRQAAVAGNRPDQHEVREAQPDPGGAQDGRGDRNCRGLSRRRDPMQDERERQRRQEPSDRPVQAAETRAEQREDRPCIRGEHERAQRPDHERVLVQR